MHIVDGPLHQGMYEPLARIFRISGNTCDSAHIHNVVMDIYLHGINYDHGSQFFPVKPSQDVSRFQDGAFGIFYFVLLPAGLEQFV